MHLQAYLSQIVEHLLIYSLFHVLRIVVSFCKIWLNIIYLLYMRMSGFQSDEGGILTS